MTYKYRTPYILLMTTRASHSLRVKCSEHDRLRPMKQHIWIITGPAGRGKTTVAKGLSEELGLPYVESDDVSSSSPTSVLK